MSHVVIIGNGIAGITAARHIRKRSTDKITVISGETDHFFSRTALMYIYMGHMKYENTKPYEDWFWDKNRIDLIRGWVSRIDFDQKSVYIDGDAISYDKLILATGSKSNKFGWPGQDLKGVQGLYSFQDLETMEKNTEDIDTAVVIGGGLIGIEMSEMLHSRGIPVVYLVREKNFWDIVLTRNEGELIDRHILEHDIDLRLSTELDRILDDGNGRVKGVVTKEGETIDCQFVGLTVGVSPNVDFLRDTTLEIEKGILVNEYLETNLPDVYAIGDCAQVRDPKKDRRPVEPIWYTGRMMGETLALTLTDSRTAYDPGVWFNSAKFFDIEYQTYGRVWPTPKEDESHFFWKADDGKKCVTIAFDNDNGSVKGVNTFGIRMRHEIWDRWIKEGVTVQYAVENLRKANFDPEFFKQHDPEIQAKFNQDFPEKQVNIRKKGLFESIFN